MSRYDLIGYCSYRDNETGLVADNFVEVLNQQDKKIKVLERALKRCFTTGVGFIDGLYDEAIRQAEKEVKDE